MKSCDLEIQNLQGFNVLDRHEKVHRSALLEASAGTGKTFAIENIVVRLLIEPSQSPPLLIEDMLIVTFTKASARDLKERILSNLEKVLKIVRTFLKSGLIQDDCPDYLLKVIENGDSEARKAKQQIEQALFSFDQANIFTIHGFCWRMIKSYALEGGISLEATSKEDQSHSFAKIDQATRDFIRTEIDSDMFSRAQLKIVLKDAANQIDKLQKKLLDVVNKGVYITPPKSLSVQLQEFENAIKYLKNVIGVTPQKIITEAEDLIPCFKDFAGEKLAKMAKIKRFASVFSDSMPLKEAFDLLIEDGIVLFEPEYFDPNNLKKTYIEKKELLDTHPLFKPIRDVLVPVINESRSKLLLFSRMAHHASQFMRRYQAQEEMLGHDDLLLKMEESIAIPEFAKKVRECFKAVIVDEFQDTDPVQWNIFSSLFMDKNCPWNGFLYLVGDPKQSIYSFRQADIYTYLKAADLIGEPSIATLDTNFRSEPKLLQGLNTLFSSAGSLFPLPKNDLSLPYKPVKAGKTHDSEFKDEMPPLQFWVVEIEEMKKGKKPPKGLSNKVFYEIEEKYLFPEFVKEIKRLQKEDGISFSKCAILISDRHQSKRVKEYLEGHGIPVKTDKLQSIADSSALEAMRASLDGILHFQNSSALKLFLTTPLIGIAMTELVELTSGAVSSKMNAILRQSASLQKILIQDGFAAFYNELLHSHWDFTKEGILDDHSLSVREKLLRNERGGSFYQTLSEVADLIIIQEKAQGIKGEMLLSFIDSFDALAASQDERMSPYVDQDEEGVSVLTTFVSKGLEYDIVFPLGILERYDVKEQLIVSENDERALVPMEKESPLFLNHCIEIDAEKMRQLYVALTRAKYRLYIPFVISQGFIDKGSASPLDLLLARINTTDITYDELYLKIASPSIEPLQELVNENQSLIHLKVLKESHLEEAKIGNEAAKPLLPPNDVKIPGAPKTIQSFTSLLHGSALITTDLSYDIEEPSKETIFDDPILMPHDFSIDIKSAHTLPAGKDTGILLHHILEMIPFGFAKGEIDPSCLIPWVRPLIAATPFAPWENVILQIIFNALTVKLGDKEKPFSLCDISMNRVYRETEFIYACNQEKSNPLINEGMKIEDGYLKGVIDLIFEHEGKYYLLDWKSNWLGNSADDYNLPKLDFAMKENRYDCQAKFYIEALRRYLAIFNIDFDSSFGGVYYLFLRGLTNNTGVWRG